MREAGQNVAALWASQAAIYQRYGYAMTTVLKRYAVDTVDIRFHDDDGGNGRVARVDLDEAYDVVKGIYIQFIADRMCYLHRAKALWLQNALKPVEADGPIWVAVCYDADDEPQGYVIYTSARGQGGPRRARPGTRSARSRLARPGRLPVLVALHRQSRPRGPGSLEQRARGRPRHSNSSWSHGCCTARTAKAHGSGWSTRSAHLTERGYDRGGRVDHRPRCGPADTVERRHVALGDRSRRRPRAAVERGA